MHCLVAASDYSGQGDPKTEFEGNLVRRKVAAHVHYQPMIPRNSVSTTPIVPYLVIATRFLESYTSTHKCHASKESWVFVGLDEVVKLGSFQHRGCQFHVLGLYLHI